MGSGTIRIVLLLAATLPLRAELKIRPRVDGKSGRMAAAAARDAVAGVRRHYLVPEERLFELRDDVFVVARVPGAGYIISAESGSMDGHEIDPESKLSSDLSDVHTTFFVVEFFPDADPARRESIVRAAGFVPRSRPDLVRDQLLIEGERGKLIALAAADEVAYVFPASADLVRGEPVYACLNTATGSPGAGQYIATYGDGWDGPGRGSASLTYSFGTLTERLPADQVKQIVARALAEWSQYAALTFAPTGNTMARRNINVLFAAGAHGDDYPFDGRGGVLAHTYFPSTVNPEPLAGDMHLDAAENWQAGADVDLFSVVLHELGHALGLGHSDNPAAVMYPYYRRVTSLAPPDGNAIQGLYAAPGANSLTISAPQSFTTTAASAEVQGTVSGGSGDLRISWSTNHGNSGMAEGGRQWRIQSLPLTFGANQLTVTAQDSVGRTATANVVITRAVSSPVLRVTSAAAGVISGTASHPSGIRQVTWEMGIVKGAATGTTNWSAAIPLQSLPATVRFTAIAVDGTEGFLDYTITLVATARDTTPPSVNITAPAGTTITTTHDAIALSGTATDNGGVAQVKWSTNTGLSGVAAGTTSWSIDSVPLYVGYNVVTIRAVDAAGNVGWRAVAITRTK